MANNKNWLLCATVAMCQIKFTNCQRNRLKKHYLSYGNYIIIDHLKFKINYVQNYLPPTTRFIQTSVYGNQLTGFYTTQALTERCFRTDHNTCFNLQ